MNMKAFALSAATAATCLFSAPATAAVITSLPGGTALPIAASTATTSGPQTLAPGINFSASEPAYLGHTGYWGFDQNGSWSGMPMMGLNSATGFFEIAFDAPVSAILAELNWATNTLVVQASMQIFDSAGNLLESQLLEDGGNILTPGYLGFSRAQGDIAKIRFSNEFIGARNISYAATSAVPEPATWAFMITGFGLIGTGMRRRQKAAVGYVV